MPNWNQETWFLQKKPTLWSRRRVAFFVEVQTIISFYSKQNNIYKHKSFWFTLKINSSLKSQVTVYCTVYCIFCCQRIYQKAFLNWLCQYLIFSINIFWQYFSFPHTFSNRFCPVEKCEALPNIAYIVIQVLRT